MVVRCELQIPSLGIAVRHHLESLVMPNCYPRDGINGSYCLILLTIMKDPFLDQVVTEPTRITETTPSIREIFFTSNQTLINKVEVIPGISDHEAVFIESSLKPMKVNTPARKVYQYRKTHGEGVKIHPGRV